MLMRSVVYIETQIVNIKQVYVSGKAVSGWIGTEILLLHSLELKDYATVIYSRAIVCERCQGTSHIVIVCRTLGIPVVQVESIHELSAQDAFATIDFSANSIVITEGKSFNGLAELNSENEDAPPSVFSSLTYQLGIVDNLDHIRKTCTAIQDNVEQLFLRSELMWLSLQVNPFSYFTSHGLADTVDLISNELENIYHEIEKKNIILNFRGLDLRSDQKLFEEACQQKEPNPNLGLHGTRQLLVFKEYLSAELLAVDYLYDCGCTQVSYSLPFIISHKEIEEVIVLRNSICKNQFKIGVYIETPAAVLDIANIIKLGISYVYIGTKDLAQLILAVDRDNSAVSHLMNLLDSSVTKAISYVVEACKDTPVYVFSLPKYIPSLLNKLPNITRVSIPAADYLQIFDRDGSNLVC